MGVLIDVILDLLGTKLTVFIIAALPVIELRGAIPVGITLGMSPINSTVISFLGSTLPAPFILFGIRPIFDFLRKTKFMSNIIDRIINRSINSHGNKIQKYGTWGLILLVAIPLPGTGVWTGSLIASLLDIRFKWAFPAIIIGNIIAAILIMLLSSGVATVISAS